MTGILNKITVLLLPIIFISCENGKENHDKENDNDNIVKSKDTLFTNSDQCDQSHLGTCSYIDNDLCEGGTCLICKDPENHEHILAKSGDNEYDILTYEGLLVSAYSVEGGKRLIFEPFDFWDYDLEMEVESKYSENLEIDISSGQNEYLGFAKTNSSTDNLKWDYLENLFTVYYYEDKSGKKIPLNFIDHGKQEWDG